VQGPEWAPAKNSDAVPAARPGCDHGRIVGGARRGHHWLQVPAGPCVP